MQGCLLGIMYIVYIVVVINISMALDMGPFGFIVALAILPLSYYIYRFIRKKVKGCITYASGEHAFGLEGAEKGDPVTIYLYMDRVTFNDIQIIPIERVKSVKSLDEKIYKYTARGIGGIPKEVFKFSHVLLDIQYVNRDGKEATIQLSNYARTFAFHFFAQKLNAYIDKNRPKDSGQVVKRPTEPFEL
ncbi:hypothetical protein RZN22_18630 [Bacillaceae bacterium S4-13-58]